MMFDVKLLRRTNAPEPGTDEVFCSIADTSLSARAKRCLYRNGVMTTRHLMEKSEEELLQISNLGVRTLQEIRDFKRLLHAGEPAEELMRAVLPPHSTETEQSADLPI